MQKAFDNWNAANSTSNANGNGSGVTFGAITFGSPVNPSGKTNVYQVTYSSKKPDGTTISDPGVTGGEISNGVRANGTSTINTSQTTCDEVTVTVAHEIGHTMGLGDCTQCADPAQSVEFPRLAPFSVPPYNVGPTPCDNKAVVAVYPPPNPLCNEPCKPGYFRLPPACACVPVSPIILDLDGKGFDLTSAVGGVKFDMSGTGNPIQMGWIAQGADNAFLALPGPDGLVHSGKELFGNFTPQPPSDHPNGFAVLAVYDKPENGGNGDGIIDSNDAIFASLRLWIDANHDGVSQPGELYTLPSKGVNSLSLEYRESDRTDKYGNKFRYRAEVNPDHTDSVGRLAYDVFFVTESTSGALNKTCPVPRQPALSGTSLSKR